MMFCITLGLWSMTFHTFLHLGHPNMQSWIFNIQYWRIFIEKVPMIHSTHSSKNLREIRMKTNIRNDAIEKWLACIIENVVFCEVFLHPYWKKLGGITNTPLIFSRRCKNMNEIIHKKSIMLDQQFKQELRKKDSDIYT